MKFLDLFSGIGGFRLGMEMAGHECVGHCEIDKFANKSYIAIHEPKENEWFADDITQVKAEDIPYADVWCFGFPCFTGDMLVLTDTGYKEIKDIQIGEKVYTHKKRFRNVVNTFDNGRYEIWKLIVFNTDEIKTTANHKFYVITRSEKWNGSLKKYEYFYTDPYWKECKDLTKEDYIASATQSDNHFKLENIIKNKCVFKHDTIWYPVKSVINTFKKENVYDIEVEEDHSFTVQGLIAHNCQDISVAGKQEGLKNGRRSGLFFTVTDLIRNKKEEDRPKLLFIENVKNLLSINKGYDFLSVLTELDEIGYDAQWQIINSADYVPQNRERIFIIGHLRGGSTREIFPISRNAEQNSIKQIGKLKNRDGNNCQAYRVYDVDHLAPTLSTMQGGGQTPCIFIDLNSEPKITETARTIQARYYKGYSKHKGETSGVLVPVITPNRVNKRQNGRRFKNDGDDMFTLTAQDIHGVYDGYRIRRLTPRECWRLQGFPDWAFDKAQMAGVSDTQLYKQAGNSVTVDVIYEIAKKLKCN